jgi:hypothetical protein
MGKRKFRGAVETWKRATATYEKAGNKMGVIGSLINQAEALQALGLSTQAANRIRKSRANPSAAIRP